MIEYYQFVGGTITQVDTLEEDCWVSVVAPNPEEREWLSTQLGVVPEFAAAALDDEERSHVDYDEDERQTLIIVDCPFVEDRAETMDPTTTQYDTHPLSILLLPKRKLFVTVTLRYNETIHSLSKRARGNPLGRHPKLLLDVLMKVARRYLTALRDIDRQFKANERVLRSDLRNDELIKMLGLEKSLVYFSTSLKSFEMVLAKLANGRLVRFSDDEEEYLQDVKIEEVLLLVVAKGVPPRRQDRGAAGCRDVRHLDQDPQRLDGRLLEHHLEQHEHHHPPLDGHHLGAGRAHHHLQLLRHEHGHPAAG